VVVNQDQLTRYIVTTKAENIISNEEAKREAHLKRMRGWVVVNQDQLTRYIVTTKAENVNSNEEAKREAHLKRMRVVVNQDQLEEKNRNSPRKKRW
ncbi:7306_t:CDS:2, partial [Dentiscutata erythropus]